MPHFADGYLDRVIATFHRVLNPTWFYKQELIEVPGVVTALFITYDGLRDDSREIRDQSSWEGFEKRVLAVSPDWGLTAEFLKEAEAKNPKFAMGGWERRTIY